MEATSVLTGLKLTGDNWVVWKFQSEVTLKGRGLFEIVNGGSVKPDQPEAGAVWMKSEVEYGASYVLDKGLHQVSDSEHYEFINNKGEVCATATCVTSNNVLKCILCNGTHLLYKCPAFVGKTPQERYNFAKSKNLCLNCLSTIHRSQQCKSSKKCLTCNRFHHTLLHLGSTPGTTHDTLASAASSSITETDVSANVNSSPSQEILSASSLVSTHATVLLSTAIVGVVDNKGCYQPLRCLVDSGSMTSFITQRAGSKLGIRKCPANIEIKGLGCTNVLETTKGSVTLSFCPTGKRSPLLTIDAIVLNKICDNLPPERISIDISCNNLCNLKLADPGFGNPNQIDILLGADVFPKIILPGHTRIPGNDNFPSALNTIDLTATIKKLWEVEGVPEHACSSVEDKFCENHFLETHKRTDEGKYVVALPFRDGLPVFDRTIRDLAESRFLSLERRICTGTSCKTTALKLRNELISLLQKGGFSLRKWSSNDPNLLSDLSPDILAKSAHTFDTDPVNLSLKVLGLQWNQSTDAFSFSVSFLDRPCTKRNMLSELARIYDPLGFLSPLTIFMKILIQKLWMTSLNWDDTPPIEITRLWGQYKTQLSHLSKLEVPRQSVIANEALTPFFLLWPRKRISIIGFNHLLQKKEMYHLRLQSPYEFSRNISEDSAVLAEFYARLNDIHKYRELFEQCISEINRLNSAYKPRFKPSYQEIQSFDQLYYKILSVAATLANNSGGVRPRDITNSNSNQPRSVKPRLPKLELFHFDSKLENWPTFFDTFSSLIHNNTDISNTEKFYYLLTAVSGPALSLVKSLPVTEDNYLIIWNSLVKKYENKRALATSYLDKLFQFKPLATESAAGLNLFLQTFQESVKALKILKIDDLSSFLLFYIALRNLDPVTRREFEQTVEQEAIPTFQGLIMLVEKHLRVIEMSESKTIPHTKHSSYKSVNPGTSKSSKACLSAVSANKSNVKNCLFCQKPHSIYKCFEYNELTPPERLKRVKELKLCENCLRINHSVAQCLSKIRCSVCKQMHHHTLHIDCNAISDNSQLQAAGSSKDQAVTLTCCSSSTVLLGTAIVHVSDA
nr:unnamed protein product [Callosobruchus analis]